MEYFRSGLAPGLSPPLLIDPPEAYFSQRTRLMIIGQQTQTWWDKRFRTDEQDQMIGTYTKIYREEFALAVGTRRGGAFWQAVRSLEQRLRIALGAVVWTNLNKLDQRATRPTPDVEATLLEKFPVVIREIGITQPDVVVFFTGPAYDRLLSNAFPGAVLQELGRYDG
jgi:hypothetical protein